MPVKMLYPEKSASDLWRMIGVTPLIGVNDNPREVFYPSDAELLLGFARQKGLGLISMWSLGRDKPATEGLQGQAAPMHSGLAVDQAHDIVTHVGAKFRCKPWPCTGWCSVGGP